MSEALDRAGTTYRQIAVDLIDDAGDDMRRVAATERSDAALISSVRRRGVLQPIGVRPSGNHFQIVFGRRRLRAARAAGLPSIPADVRPWTDEELRAVQAVENMQRLPPHPIDVWCTVRDLVDAGYTIANAAEELGLADRETRKMEHLGRLHPDLLALIEIEMPRDPDLRTIANATIKKQQATLKGLGSGKVIVQLANGSPAVKWREIAERCRVERILRSQAIFDHAKHPTMWDEDLFAQPDDADRFSTTEIARFMKLQQTALEARVIKERGEKRRVQLASFDASSRTIKLPKGWELISTIPTPKPRKTECAFTAVRPDGSIVEVVAEDRAARRAEEKRKAERTKAATARDLSPAASRARNDQEVAAIEWATGEAQAAEDDAGDDTPPVEAEAASRPAIKQAGLDLIAAAKTQALHERLAWIASEAEPLELLRLMLLALLADNVALTPSGVESAITPAVSRLILPGGGPAPASGADLRTLTAGTLRSLLIIGGPGISWYRNKSGAAAEWIGAAIGAAEALTRLDTEEFLAHVPGETLREIAQSVGIKSTGPVAALRQKLIGNAPNWRPNEAQFGAPAPISLADNDA